MKLANRTFIVSGGSSGLGLATVLDLLRAKAFVAIFDKAAPPDLDLEPSSSEPLTPRMLYVQMDITVLAQVESAVERVVEWTSSTGALLGGLINGAGVAIGGQLVDRKGNIHSPDSWDTVLAVNLTGTFHLTRLVAKHLVQVPREDTIDGERGVVIMVSSTAAYEGQKGQLAYAASKGAVRSMTLPMARDFARHKIRVVTIAPGPFETPMTGSFFSNKVDKSLKKNVMLYPGRYGRSDEFAATVRWILECPYVNGESFKLTGGARIPAVL